MNGVYMAQQVFIGYFGIKGTGVRKTLFRPAIEYPHPPTTTSLPYTSTKDEIALLLYIMLSENKLFPVDDLDNDNPDFATDVEALIDDLITGYEVGKKSSLNISLIGNPGTEGVAAILRMKGKSAGVRIPTVDFVLPEAIPPEIAAFVIANTGDVPTAGSTFLLDGAPTLTSGTTINLEYSITATIDDVELEDGVPQALDHEFTLPIDSTGKTLTVTVYATNLVGVDTIEETFVIAGEV